MESGSTTSRARLKKQSYASNRSSTGYAASEASDISAGPEKWRRVRRGVWGCVVYSANYECFFLLLLASIATKKPLANETRQR